MRAILSSSLRLFSILIPRPVCGGESLYRTVSWIRQDSLHLLTVGRYTYTSDLRWEAAHSPHSLDWALRCAL